MRAPRHAQRPKRGHIFTDGVHIWGKPDDLCQFLAKFQPLMTCPTLQDLARNQPTPPPQPEPPRDDAILIYNPYPEAPAEDEDEAWRAGIWKPEPISNPVYRFASFAPPPKPPQSGEAPKPGPHTVNDGSDFD
jgi:hypothetical protein